MLQRKDYNRADIMDSQTEERKEEEEQQEETGGGIFETLKEKVSEAADAIKHTFSSAGEAAGEAYDSAKERGREGKDEAVGAAEETFESAKERAREGKDEAVEAGSKALQSTEEVLRRLFYPQPHISIPNHNIVEQAKDEAASLPQRVGDLFTGGTNIKPSEESKEKQKEVQQQQGY